MSKYFSQIVDSLGKSFSAEFFILFPWGLFFERKQVKIAEIILGPLYLSTILGSLITDATSPIYFASLINYYRSNSPTEKGKLNFLT